MSTQKRFLRGVRARIDRAEEHLSELRAFFDDLRKDHLDASAGELVTGAATDAIGIELSEPRTSVLIGEIVYNLRDALDYLVYALAWLDSGQPQDGTQFPTDDTPAEFARHRNKYLKGISDPHVARIEDLQPYRVDWTKLLQSLSNPDKHRHLTRLHEIGTSHYRRIGAGARMVDESNRYTVRPPQTYERVTRTRDITFADGTPVVDTLEKLLLRVSETLQAFEPDF